MTVHDSVGMMISGLVIGSVMGLRAFCAWAFSAGAFSAGAISAGAIATGTLLTGALVIAGPAGLPVRVTTSDGETVQGQLGSIGTVSLNIDRDGQTVEVPFEQLVTLEPLSVEEGTGPTLVVTLLDGSKVAATDVSLADETLTIRPRRQQPLVVKVRDVKSIRFRGATTTTDATWLGLLEQQGRGDLLAIRREGDRLDPYPGIVQGIGNGNVSFDMEGTSVQAPIEKLEGVVFGGNRSVAEDSPIRVTDVYGSTWAVERIMPRQPDQPLRIELGGKVVHELPLEQIASIRWSGGMQLLASAKAARKSFQPYFPTNVEPAILDAWFAPGSDNDSDLVTRGDSSIEFRIEAGFNTLAGSVQREASVRQAGVVTFRILVDDQVQWEEQIDGQERLGFELKLDQARRVRFEADCGEDGDLGDTLRIIRPRLMK